MQRCPRIMAFHVAGWTGIGVEKGAFAVFQRLAFHAAGANRSPGYDHPFSVPLFDASLPLQA